MPTSVDLSLEADHRDGRSRPDSGGPDKDYRLEIRVRNARLLRTMRARGHATAADLARASGVSQTIIGQYLSLQRTPYRHDRLRPSALKIAIALGRPVDELWPPQHLDTPLPRATAAIDLSLDDIAAVTSAVDVEQLVERKLLVRKLLTCLTPRQRAVIERRYGIDRDEPEFLDDIARDLNVTRERVRQMQGRAERRLRQRAEQLGAGADG